MLQVKSFKTKQLYVKIKSSAYRVFLMFLKYMWFPIQQFVHCYLPQLLLLACFVIEWSTFSTGLIFPIETWPNNRQGQEWGSNKLQVQCMLIIISERENMLLSEAYPVVNCKYEFVSLCRRVIGRLEKKRNISWKWTFLEPAIMFDIFIAIFKVIISCYTIEHCYTNFSFG